MGRKRRGGRKRYVLLGLFFLAAFLPLSGWVPGLFPGTGSSPKDDTPRAGRGDDDDSFEVVVLRAEDQTPIQGARVLVHSVRGSTEEGVSDAQGKVGFPRQEGTYRVDVFAADRLEQLWADPVDRLELELPRMETRKGTARRADGTAVTGTVRLVRKDGIEIGETRTDAQGRYEFPLSPDLRYALLEPDEGPPAAAPVDEPLVVLPGKPFIGIFSRGGEPAMDVYIRFAPPGLDRSVVARATWPVAPHGTYEGMVPEGAEVWGIRDGIAVKLGLEGQMLPKKVAVSGRVLADDQRPVSGARVSFKPYAEGDFPAPVPPVEVRTNTEGKFALELAQGRYDIRVWHGDFVPESIYEFETGAKPLEVQMERGRFLQGRVQREDGTPIVGARVSVPWKNRHTLAYSSGMRTAMASVSGMRTDRNGRFIVGRFPKTAQHITVSRGDTYQRYDLASLSDPIVLTLSE